MNHASPYRARAGIAALSAVLLALTACTPAPPSSRTVAVDYVIDGDTIVVDGGERVRLLGVDAPEVARDGSIGEPCAAEATRLIEETIGDREVTLTGDPTQPEVDKYGRTLAYVDVAGTDLSARLLTNGLADLYRNASDISRYPDYEALHAKAPHPACAA